MRSLILLVLLAGCTSQNLTPRDALATAITRHRVTTGAVCDVLAKAPQTRAVCRLTLAAYRPITADEAETIFDGVPPMLASRIDFDGYFAAHGISLAR
jgi:hypothetical protein